MCLMVSLPWRVHQTTRYRGRVLKTSELYSGAAPSTQQHRGEARDKTLRVFRGAYPVALHHRVYSTVRRSNR